MRAIYFKIIVILVIIFAIGRLSYGGPDTGKTIEAMLKNAKKFYQKGDYQKCIEINKQALKQFPNSSQAYYAESGIATAEIGLGNFDKAKDLILSLIERYPDADWMSLWEYQLAFIAYKKGETIEALEILDDYLNKYPAGEYTARSYLLASSIYEENNNYEEALNAAEKAYFKFPRDDLADNAILIIASLLKQQNKYSRAIKYYEKLTKEYPDSDFLPNAYLQLGLHHEKEAMKQKSEIEFKKAITNYEKVIEVAPRTLRAFKAHLYMGKILYALANYFEAEKHFSRSLDAEDKKIQCEARYWIAAINWKKGNLDQAKDGYQEIISNCSSNIWKEKAGKQLSRINSGNQQPLTLKEIFFRKELSTENARVTKTITKTVSMDVDCNLILRWEAKPVYKGGKEEGEFKDLERITVTCKIEQAQAMLKIGKLELDKAYIVRWLKGPGPFQININQNTRLSDLDRVKAEAVMEVEISKGETIECKPVFSTFDVKEFITSLQDK